MVGEQQRHTRVPVRVVGLLRVAEAGGDVDRGAALLVVRGHRPGDRLLAGVDRRELGGDEALEALLTSGGRLLVTAAGYRCRVPPSS